MWKVACGLLFTAGIAAKERQLHNHFVFTSFGSKEIKDLDVKNDQLQSIYNIAIANFDSEDPKVNVNFAEKEFQFKGFAPNTIETNEPASIVEIPEIPPFNVCLQTSFYGPSGRNDKNIPQNACRVVQRIFLFKGDSSREVLFPTQQSIVVDKLLNPCVHLDDDEHVNMNYAKGKVFPDAVGIDDHYQSLEESLRRMPELDTPHFPDHLFWPRKTGQHIVHYVVSSIEDSDEKNQLFTKMRNLVSDRPDSLPDNISLFKVNTSAQTAIHQNWEIPRILKQAASPALVLRTIIYGPFPEGSSSNAEFYIPRNGGCAIEQDIIMMDPTKIQNNMFDAPTEREQLVMRTSLNRCELDLVSKDILPAIGGNRQGARRSRTSSGRRRSSSGSLGKRSRSSSASRVRETKTKANYRRPVNKLKSQNFEGKNSKKKSGSSSWSRRELDSYRVEDSYSDEEGNFY